MNQADIAQALIQLTGSLKPVGATTASDAQSDMPYFASALLGHSHPRIADEHYKRNSSLNVQKDYAQLILEKYLGPQ